MPSCLLFGGDLAGKGTREGELAQNPAQPNQVFPYHDHQTPDASSAPPAVLSVTSSAGFFAANQYLKSERRDGAAANLDTKDKQRLDECQ
jgi:hypothetical protein